MGAVGWGTVVAGRGGVQSSFGVRVGRHKACPYRGHGGRIRGTTRVGARWHRQYAGDSAPTWHGVWGALRGESPRTREGRRPDRPEGQFLVGSFWFLVLGGEGALGLGGLSSFGRIFLTGLSEIAIMEKTEGGECVMGVQRVKYSGQAAPELLSAMREIARGEGRQFEAVMEEAMAEYIASRRGRGRGLR